MICLTKLIWRFRSTFITEVLLAAVEETLAGENCIAPGFQRAGIYPFRPDAVNKEKLRPAEVHSKVANSSELDLTDKEDWPRAVVRQFIDCDSGLLEMLGRDEARGPVIFHSGQVWPWGPHGGPYLGPDTDLRTVLEIGQLVHVNVRGVDSVVAKLQATVVWPWSPAETSAGPPRHQLDLGLLDWQLEEVQHLARRDLVPLCVNGVEPAGVIKARVDCIVDDYWGLVEVRLVGREGETETSRRFLCIFHKSDIL
jgi:hypothetical protein